MLVSRAFEERSGIPIFKPDGTTATSWSVTFTLLINQGDHMPKGEPKPHGQTPKQNRPEELHFERGLVTCQRCKRKFEHFVLEEIDDLVQLRCGDILIPNAELVCMHCGWIFYWHLKKDIRADVSTMATTYRELLIKTQNYTPE
jgi:hypothetical protein